MVIPDELVVPVLIWVAAMAIYGLLYAGAMICLLFRK